MDYQEMRDDYVFWQAQWLNFKTKKMFIKKYWVIKENFNREELHQLWIDWEYTWFDPDAELESDAQMIAEYEETL